MATDLTNFTIEIKQICLSVESVRLDPKKHTSQLATLSRSTLHFPFDTFLSSVAHVPPNLSDTDITFPVERRCQLAYFGMFYQHQLNFNASSKKWGSFRSIWPKGLDRLRFYLNGEEIIFENGLGEMTGTPSNGSLEVLRYHQYLAEKGFLDAANPNYVPRGAKNSYRMIIPLDLSTFNVEANSELTVHMSFGQNHSPLHLQAYLLRVVEGDLIREQVGSVKRWTVIPSLSSLSESK